MMKYFTPIQKLCEYCGAQYTAYKSSTRFCSPKCIAAAYSTSKKTRHARKLNEQAQQVIEQQTRAITCKPYVSPKELSVLLGVSRATIYRYLEQGLLKVLQFPGKMIIKMSDVEAQFGLELLNQSAENDGYNRGIYYSLKEVCTLYNMSRFTVLHKCEELGVPQTRLFGRVHYLKSLIHLHLDPLLTPVNLNKYYSMSEAMERYKLSASSIYRIAKEYKVTSLSYKGTTYFYKTEIEAARRKHNEKAAFDGYYTFEEIQKRFKLGIYAAKSLAKAEGIELKNSGTYVLFPREEFEQAVGRRLERISQEKQEIRMRRKDVDDLKKKRKDAAIQKSKKSAPEGYYSTEEIALPRKITISTVHHRAHALKIEYVTFGNKRFYNKEQVDRLMPIDESLSDITDWMTGREIQEMMGMTRSARLGYVKKHNFPRKMENGMIYYSRQHVLQAIEEEHINNEDFYSVKEIKEKYNITYDAVRYYVKRDHIEFFRQGRQIFIARADFDLAMDSTSMLRIADPNSVTDFVFHKEKMKAPVQTPANYYSLKEIAALHGIGIVSAHKILNENKVVGFQFNRTKYYQKDEVDLLFKGPEESRTITEWLTMKEIQQTYNLSPYLCSAFVKEHKIPWKIEKTLSYYSKSHLAEAMEKADNELLGHSTVEELSDSLGIPPSNLYHYITRLGLEKIYRNKIIYINQEGVDKLTSYVEEKLGVDSKPHLFRILENEAGELSVYYSAAYLTKTLNLPPKKIYHYITRLKMEKITRGKTVYFSQAETDRLQAHLERLNKLKKTPDDKE